MINTIKEKYNAFAIFSYGSAVYENKKPADYDFIVISDKDYFQESFIHNGINLEISNYNQKEFFNLLNDHDISMIECIKIDHPKKYINNEITNLVKNFEISKDKLRIAISSKSSNSYVKAKKKLIVEEDFDINISLKSLWHSFRILDFGIQIVEKGFIEPTSQNKLYDEILKDYLLLGNNWESIHDKYKKEHNKLNSQFKLLCPKQIKNNFN